MTAPRHLAVYGTLRPGEANAHVLADVPGTWTTGTIRATRYDDGWHGYPGIVLGGDGSVAVDVLAATDLLAHVARLDAFEGPGYRRVTAQVELADGEVVDAWVYELVAPPA